MSKSPGMPSYGDLTALVAEQAARLVEYERRFVEQGLLIEALQVEVEALRRKEGRDSSNSSQPPSQDGPAAKAKAKADKRSAVQDQADGQDPQDGPQDPKDGEPGGERKPAAQQLGPKRAQGGQRGHRGSGLERVAHPERTLPVEPPACGGCGGDLTGAPGQIASSVQVFDIPTFCLAVTDYLMMRRDCGCGRSTTADLPPGVRGGPTCFGPQVVGAATLLASQDVIGIERTADLMSALLGVEVSTGFISSCLARLDAALTAAQFEDALKAALRAADVLGTDETPAPLTEAATAEDDCHNPHVYTVRTMCAYTGGGPDLVWFGAAGDRTKPSISAFGILDEFRGILVRDDFGGYISYDTDLAGVQQCLAHLLRYLDDAYAIDLVAQVWARQVADALRTAIHEVNTARAEGRTRLEPDLLARLRRSYDQGVAFGISTNLSRPWHKGNHPGLKLARRLKRKAHQVWFFTGRAGFDVPATNNGSENAVRGFKLAAKVKGCWRTLETLQRHCRIRSYLVSARNHGRRPVDAICDALTGTPWMPPTQA
jgi:transposase